jgi:5'-deoxynucleotidase
MHKIPFYSYLTRLRWIKRWGLMRNSYDENVMEHSWEVAIISHSLALIKNEYFDGKIDANKLVVSALYHDATEVITGDLPTPIKYYSPDIMVAYKTIEQAAANELCSLLPEKLQSHLISSISQSCLSDAEKELIKIADKISAYLKCAAELKAGNPEFQSVAELLLKTITDTNLPEVKFFMKTFSLDGDCCLNGLVNRKVDHSIKHKQPLFG